MKTVERKVKPVRVYAICDKCNIHYTMEKSARMLMSNPPIYTYYCGNCGHEERSSENYPRIEYR
jgi:uncharacterized protein YlaI